MKKKTQTPAEVEATKQKASDAVDSLTRTPAADATKPPAAPSASGDFAKPPAIQDPPKPAAVPSPPRDGFGDIDDRTSSPIKGTRIKFTNEATWVTDTEDVIKPDHRFIMLGMRRTVQKWLPGLPTPEKTIDLGENEAWPDVKAWNDAAPRSEWSVKFGVDTGPYKRCWFCYLLDPRSYEGYTYPGDTVGGIKAIGLLKEATNRARLLEGRTNIYPVVTLADAFMPTRYGGRQRPDFAVVDWETIGPSSAPSAPALAKPADKPADAADKKPADKNADDLNDDIPY